MVRFPSVRLCFFFFFWHKARGRAFVTLDEIRQAVVQDISDSIGIIVLNPFAIRIEGVDAPQGERG